MQTINSWDGTFVSLITSVDKYSSITEMALYTHDICWDGAVQTNCSLYSTLSPRQLSSIDIWPNPLHRITWYVTADVWCLYIDDQRFWPVHKQNWSRLERRMVLLRIIHLRNGCTNHSHLPCKIQDTHSWSSWNFWSTATFRKICILLRNSDESSLQANDPAQEQCSAKCAALIWLHLRHTRSWRWYSFSLWRIIWRRAFSITSRS